MLKNDVIRVDGGGLVVFKIKNNFSYIYYKTDVLSYFYSKEKKMGNLKKRLIGEGLTDSLLLDDMDEAVTGITSDGAVVYDYYLLIDLLREGDSQEDYDDAEDYLNYNIIRGLQYMKPYGIPPVIMKPL